MGLYQYLRRVRGDVSLGNCGLDISIIGHVQVLEKLSFQVGKKFLFNFYNFLSYSQQYQIGRYSHWRFAAFPATGHAQVMAVAGKLIFIELSAILSLHKNILHLQFVGIGGRTGPHERCTTGR